MSFPAGAYPITHLEGAAATVEGNVSTGKVPAGEMWRMVAITTTYAASAQAASRVPYITWKVTSPGYAYYSAFCPTIIKASEVVIIEFIFGQAGGYYKTEWSEAVEGVKSAIQIFLPELVAREGNVVELLAFKNQTEDKQIEPNVSYEKLPI